MEPKWAEVRCWRVRDLNAFDIADVRLTHISTYCFELRFSYLDGSFVETNFCENGVVSAKRRALAIARAVQGIRDKSSVDLRRIVADTL